MVRIAISQAAFDAVAATLPLGSVAYDFGSHREGRINRLAAMRGPADSYADVILRIAVQK